MKKLLLICSIATVITGCANEALIKETQSGKAEAEYPNYTQEQVIDAIVQYCNGKGFSIEEQQKNFVICSKQMTGGAAIFTQMAIGNSYSTTPQAKARYSVAKYKNGTKAWAEAYAETQMALGQVRKDPLDGNKTRNELQRALDDGIKNILKNN